MFEQLRLAIRLEMRLEHAIVLSLAFSTMFQLGRSRDMRTKALSETAIPLFARNVKVMNATMLRDKMAQAPSIVSAITPKTIEAGEF